MIYLKTVLAASTKQDVAQTTYTMAIHTTDGVQGNETHLACLLHLGTDGALDPLVKVVDCVTEISSRGQLLVVNGQTVVTRPRSGQNASRLLSWE